ncbi:MAG: DUF4412 domain-containing protein [Balneolaceae bacterium]|nr:DUF4412 domain-containing protein [Balneolaceae bacterium]MBO6544823.1 DUF4412 domain-containing protein [Balneolaceae bacterium]MBO6646219.1 DUF4412 domain-containing protein [Balneolaceae bacterium]
MKQGIKVLLALFVISAVSVDVNAQLLKRLKNKAKDRVNEKIENKIDQKLEEAANKMVDRTWESVFGQESESETKTKGASPRSLPFTLNSNVNTEEEYSFSRFSEMEIITTDENGSNSEPTLMKMFFNNNGEYSGTSFINEESLENNEEVFIVYDYKNEAMVMLMNSEDGKASFAYDWAQPTATIDYEESERVDYEEFSEYEELGTRTILGYECKGYKTEDEYSSTEFWVTEETDSGYQEMMNANGNTRYFQGRTMMFNSSATVMEMTSMNKETDEKMTMKMTKVDESTRMGFTMSDYPTIGSSSK